MRRVEVKRHFAKRRDPRHGGKGGHSSKDLGAILLRIALLIEHHGWPGRRPRDYHFITTVLHAMGRSEGARHSDREVRLVMERFEDQREDWLSAARDLPRPMMYVMSQVSYRTTLLGAEVNLLADVEVRHPD